MDAGKVQFVAGATLDFHLANGFKNTDTFCVRPVCFFNFLLEVLLISSLALPSSSR